MRPIHRPVFQRVVASLVLVGLAVSLAPVSAARAVRATVLDGVLDDPAAVREALVASDGAPTPEDAADRFVRAYAEATGETIATEDIAALLLGQSLQPVAPPEVKLTASPGGATGTPTASAAIAASGRGLASLCGAALGRPDAEPSVHARTAVLGALQPRAP